MHVLEFAAAVVIGAAAVITTSASAANRGAAGSCDEYMYWHDGKCASMHERELPPLGLKG
jgi:hypothetical protein